MTDEQTEQEIQAKGLTAPRVTPAGVVMGMDVRIFILAVSFGLMETAYFGWNLLPGSPAEVVCDGITVLLVAMSFAKRKSA